MKRDSNKVVEIPIDKIVVANPRTRGKNKFKQIVDNIARLGLKKPITVAVDVQSNGEKRYTLVCGQGRLEAYKALGESKIPAMVIEANPEEILLMSLVENLARRQHSPVELLRQIGVLKERGYSYSEIAQKNRSSAQLCKRHSSATRKRRGATHSSSRKTPDSDHDCDYSCSIK